MAIKRDNGSFLQVNVPGFCMLTWFLPNCLLQGKVRSSEAAGPSRYSEGDTDSMDSLDAVKRLKSSEMHSSMYGSLFRRSNMCSLLSLNSL